MATKTLNANVTITISTIQSSHPSAGSGEIWPKINVRLFFTKHRDPALTKSGDGKSQPPRRQISSEIKKNKCKKNKNRLKIN